MTASATGLAPVPATPRSQPWGTGLSSGEKLRLRRHEQRLTLRQVSLATHRVALNQNNEEFAISPGRLSEVETKGVVPNIYRLYSLATVYEVSFRELLAWFGIPQLP
jgi:transcriptional regulator with XRE-family HTH domain